MLILLPFWFGHHVYFWKYDVHYSVCGRCVCKNLHLTIAFYVYPGHECISSKHKIGISSNSTESHETVLTWTYKCIEMFIFLYASVVTSTAAIISQRRKTTSVWNVAGRKYWLAANDILSVQYNVDAPQSSLLISKLFVFVLWPRNKAEGVGLSVCVCMCVCVGEPPGLQTAASETHAAQSSSSHTIL